MRVLALETSDKTGSLAALDGDRVLLSQELLPDERSAKSLAPAMRDLLRQADWRPRDLELVAVTAGPGSFTGLRVGVTTAKMLAYVSGAAIVGVNTLEVIAAQVIEAEAGFGVQGSGKEVQRLSAVIDAQRQEVYCGTFIRDRDSRWTWQALTEIVPNEKWIERLEQGMHVTGPGLKKLVEYLPAGVIPIDSQLWRPLAPAVGRLGYRLYLSGQRDDAWSLVPLYVRRSAAEEKMMNDDR